MAEAPLARSQPLLAEQPWLSLQAPLERCILRGPEAVRAAAQEVFGVAVPASACRAGRAGERAALWLGPDEWLLIAPERDGGMAALRRALAGLDHSLVDVSHRQVGLTLAGPAAALLLASGCPLDLDARAFPVGMCTRTVLGKSDVVLWRTAHEEFRLEVWRSFAPYLAEYLAEAARGSI